MRDHYWGDAHEDDFFTYKAEEFFAMFDHMLADGVIKKAKKFGGCQMYKLSGLYSLNKDWECDNLEDDEDEDGGCFSNCGGDWD